MYGSGVRSRSGTGAWRCARVLGAVLLCGAAAACRSSTREVSLPQFEAIQRQIAVQEAGGQAPADAAATSPTPGPSPVPPRDAGERRARAASALPPGVVLRDVAVVGDGTRFVLALATAERDGKTTSPNLLLLDISSPAGVLRGEHSFGAEPPFREAGQPAEIARTFVIDAGLQEPVALAELVVGGADGERFFGACGWWLRARSPKFLCAPTLTPESRWDVHRGQLVESWPVDVSGGRVATTAGARTGRVLRFVGGGWQESDTFRCLGIPLPEAFKEAGGVPLAVWQQDMVRRYTRAARRAGDALDTDAALRHLRRALRVDGCSVESWRLLGRLEFDAGRPALAVPPLATAVALAPRDDAALLDLGDALAVLGTDPKSRDAWHSALTILEERKATRRLGEGPAGKSPRALARALYAEFLARTASSGEWLEKKRSRVEEKIADLDRQRRKGGR